MKAAPLTAVDRLVSFFAPAAGLARWRARQHLALVGGYDGGRRDRRAIRNFRPKEGSANADTVPDLPDLRARSRELRRNTPIATGVIATNITNVVGDGLVLQSRVDRAALGLTPDQARAWQASAQREWQLACETIDFTGAQNHDELQALILGAVLESGDVFVVRRWRKDIGDTYGTKILVVEADRVCNRDRGADSPEVVAGVRIDGNGVPVGYQVASRHPDERLTGSAKLSWADIPARDPDTGRRLVLHLFDRLRPDQARGVPYLAPVIESLKVLGNYSEAELQAAVISAMFTAFITAEPQDGGEPLVGTTDSPLVTDPQKEVALEAAGAIVELNAGQDVKIAQPARPNPVFDAFFTAIVRQIGVALELPFELVVKHFQASYSASRAALEMGWQYFRRRRSWLAWRFCQPVYEWVIEEAVASGRLSAPGFFDDPIIRQAYLGAEWIGQPRINLDPLKESNADKQDIDMGVKTRDQVIAERTGGDFDSKNEQLERESTARAKWLAPPAAAGAAGAPPEEPDDADKREETEE